MKRAEESRSLLKFKHALTTNTTGAFEGQKYFCKNVEMFYLCNPLKTRCPFKGVNGYGFTN